MQHNIFLKARQCGTYQRRYLFELMPKLAKIYQIDPTVHMIIRTLEHCTDEEHVLNLIEQIVLQNIELNKMLLSAIEQGFRPQEQK